MPLYALNDRLWFPSVNEALEDGLLALGGDLSTERLLLAYQNGIFPWYEGDVPLWWCPDPRFVLFSDELRISSSMKKLLNKNAFTFTVNKNFEQVIHHCKNVKRISQHGTWITNEVEKAYTTLYKKGFAHSAEVWLNNELAGGLYGVRLGKVFFGESMFSLVSNASKYAFINYVQQLKKENVKLIDCQVYTAHLESLGARMIPRNEFIKLLHEFVDTELLHNK
ncbi:MAG TPA: leucyl/phenylalanyl-tRNA--protein transferase [Chitinophagaceae bacterium]|nr:leucyl/phenylalanyl-tRNA--protein transferase [Chitinophagaceae bacterium]